MANISTDFSVWSGTAASNQPDSGDTATIQADLQAIQAALRTIFPSVNAAVTPTHTQLNYVNGVTSAIQTQLDSKATFAGGTFTGDITMSGASIIEAEGAAVAAAATTDIWATDGNTRHVTGNTTITSLGTAPQAGARMKLIFDGTPILTQGANLNLNGGGSNITIETDDWAEVYADTTTQFDVIVHRKSGKSIVVPNGLTSGTTIATTSGTSHDFGSIPSWAKRITFMFSGVSTNGTSIPMLQIGGGGTPETSGYLGAASGIVGTVASAAMSTGFILSNAHTAAVVYHGSVTLSLLESSGSDLWVISGTLGRSDSAATTVIGGSKSISSVLNIVRLTTVGGTDTFDAGKINIFYE